MSFGGFKNGNFVLFDGFQPAEWANSGPSPIAYQEDWYVHYLSIARENRREIAAPCMVLTDGRFKPAFKGSLKPRGEKFAPEDHQWVFLAKSGYTLSLIDDTREPTTEEYNKLFKRLFESVYPLISSRDKTSKPSIRNTDMLSEQDRYIEIVFKKREVNND